MSDRETALAALLREAQPLLETYVGLLPAGDARDAAQALLRRIREQLSQTDA